VVFPLPKKPESNVTGTGKVDEGGMMLAMANEKLSYSVVVFCLFLSSFLLGCVGWAREAPLVEIDSSLYVYLFLQSKVGLAAQISCYL
jgi:hypothetical protein